MPSKVGLVAQHSGLLTSARREHHPDPMEETL